MKNTALENAWNNLQGVLTVKMHWFLYLDLEDNDFSVFRESNLLPAYHYWLF